MRMVAQLLQDREFEIVKNMLAKQKENGQAAYWLSLLHRYHDDYEQEKALLNLVSAFDKAYAQERLAWRVAIV